MKTRKKKKKKTQTPFLDSLIDILGYMVIAAISKDKRGRPNPYKAAGIAIGTGFAKSTKDILDLGVILGMQGAFDDATYDDSDIFGHSPKTSHVLHKSVWRDFCEDGTDYRIDPKDYTCADDYGDALNEVMYNTTMDNVNENNGFQQLTPEETVPKNDTSVWMKYCSDGSPYGIDPRHFASADDYEDAVLEAMKIDADRYIDDE